MQPAPLDAAAIQAVLPHRPPFLFLDEVTEASPEIVVAVKRTSPADFYFQGHFPGRPVMPGVLLIEAMAQACLVLYAYNRDLRDVVYLAQAEARFLRPVRPGDELRLIARRVKFLATMGVAEAEAQVGGQPVATARLAFGAPAPGSRSP